MRCLQPAWRILNREPVGLHLCDFEFIVMDNCSSDGTADVARRYERDDDRLKFFVHELFAARKLIGAPRTGFSPP